jgi:hypothetical protein
LPNDPGIGWNPTSTNKIDGFIHSHYGGLLPIFSASDLLVPRYWELQGGIKNIDSFSLGVVTSSGTYFLQVTDPVSYHIFYNNWADNLSSLEFSYETIYGIGPSTSSTTAANNLAQLLKSLNSGLSLMKKDGNNFGQLNVGANNEVIVKRCLN